jgi:cell wall-associated NlpC family hydrolase
VSRDQNEVSTASGSDRVSLECPALTREAIAAAALSLVDIPFKHHGRDESLGLDCAGVLVAAFAKLGVSLREERIDYRRLPAEEHVVRCLEMNFQKLSAPTPISPVAVQEADIVHLRFKRDTAARHLGIVVEGSSGLMLVHGVQRSERVLLEPFGAVLQNATIAGVYSYPNLA